MDDEDEEEADDEEPEAAEEEEEDEAAKAAKVAAATKCAETFFAELGKAEGGGAVDDDALSEAFATLEGLRMDVGTLAASGVGKAINKMRKSAAPGLAAYTPRAKKLLEGWKALAPPR